MTPIDVQPCLEAEAFPSFANELSLTSAAVAYARRLHASQRRISDGALFILHPLEVAALLANLGAPDEVVAAGVLHDVVEDTSTTPEQIRRRFGSRVAGLVASVSEDPALESERERKAALRAQVQGAGRDAALIFAADKVAKVRELRTRIASADRSERSMPEEADRKLEHYTASLAMLERILAGQPLVRQLRFELEALSELPPRRRLERKRSYRTRHGTRITRADRRDARRLTAPRAVGAPRGHLGDAIRNLEIGLVTRCCSGCVLPGPELVSAAPGRGPGRGAAVALLRTPSRRSRWRATPSSSPAHEQLRRRAGPRFAGGAPGSVRRPSSRCCTDGLARRRRDLRTTA